MRLRREVLPPRERFTTDDMRRIEALQRRRRQVRWYRQAFAGLTVALVVTRLLEALLC